MTDTDTRDRIRRRVERDPGVHFSELTRVLDIAPGQVQYHLRELRGEEVVVDERYGRSHCFPPEYDPWERAALALLRRETSADVVAYLLDAEEAPPAEVADALGIARSTLEYHLDRLCEECLVEKHHERGRVTLVPAAPERTADLLRTADPSLPERLTDRFARLVDSLLSE
jgi:predicted transcriptional regulator